MTDTDMQEQDQKAAAGIAAALGNLIAGDNTVQLDWLYERNEGDAPEACTHSECIAMRKNLRRMEDVKDDPRIATLTAEGSYFGKLTASIMLFATLLEQPPETAALAIASAGFLTMEGQLPDVGGIDGLNEEVRVRMTGFVEPLAKSDQFQKDATVLMLAGMEEGVSPITIGVGIASLAILFADGKYEVDQNAKATTVTEDEVSRGNALLDTLFLGKDISELTLDDYDDNDDGDGAIEQQGDEELARAEAAFDVGGEG